MSGNKSQRRMKGAQAIISTIFYLTVGNQPASTKGTQKRQWKLGVHLRGGHISFAATKWSWDDVETIWLS